MTTATDEAPSTPGGIRRRWHSDIASSNVAPDSVITHIQALDNGHLFRVNTKGNTTFAQLDKRRAEIAAKLDRPLDHVLLRPDPNTRSQAKAYLTVITHDPLAGGVAYEGPCYRDGRIPMGPMLDGGEAFLTVEDETGCYGALFTGAMGSGKSTGFENAAASLLVTGIWYVVFLDGNPGGTSSQFLNRHAHIVGAGKEDAREQLQAMQATLRDRSVVLNTLIEDEHGNQQQWLDIGGNIPAGWKPAKRIRPSAQFPGLAWMVDEFHRVSEGKDGRAWVAEFEALVRDMRKHAMAPFVASQSFLAKDYGGSTPLRGFLMERNAFLFRNQNPQERGRVDGTMFDPGTLPAGGGYALCRSDEGAVKMRTRYGDLTKWMVNLPHVELEARSARHIYPLWRDPLQTRRDAVAAELEFRQELYAQQHAQPAQPAPPAYQPWQPWQYPQNPYPQQYAYAGGYVPVLRRPSLRERFKAAWHRVKVWATTNQTVG